MRATAQPFTPHAPELRVFLANDRQSDAFALICAQHLRAGDTVLLSGPVGAGKSHFARAVIRSHFGADQEVPSPTFTLVQCYEGAELEIWHADLYRLTHAGEINELGLDEAMGRYLCLIEWPDRLGTAPPKSALHIGFSFAGAGRLAEIRGATPALQRALARAFAA